MGQDNTEICTIRMMFPVESDEQAIAFKKKISVILAEIPDAQMQFSLATIPASLARGGKLPETQPQL